MFLETFSYAYATYSLLFALAILALMYHKESKSKADYIYRLKNETDRADALDMKLFATKEHFGDYITNKLQTEYPFNDPGKIEERMPEFLRELNYIEKEKLDWNKHLVQGLDTARNICLYKIMECETSQEIKEIDIPRILDYSRAHSPGVSRVSGALQSMRELRIKELAKKSTGSGVGV